MSSSPHPNVCLTGVCLPRTTGKDHGPGECGISLHCASFHQGFRDLKECTQSKNNAAEVRISENRKRMTTQGPGEVREDTLQRLPELHGALSMYVMCIDISVTLKRLDHPI